jgi:hypothetical protein
MGNRRIYMCTSRVIGIFLLTTFILPLALQAEPYFAFREGYKCSTCHVNKTGGGKRNEFGSSFTQTDFSPILEAASESALDFSTDIGESFSLGMDFMIVHETLFSVEESIDEGGRNEVYKRGAENSFDIRSGSLYLEAQLLPEILTLYLDETVSPAGASNREAFVLYDDLPHGGYVKAGRMLLPYGIRLWDDDAFIRQVTGFNYDNQDLGFEVGVEPSMFSLSLAVSNGTQGARDGNTSKQISSTGSAVVKNFVVGGSFSMNKSRGVERTLFGPYAAVRTGPLTLMGEADWIDESPGSQQFVFYSSAELWLRESLNVRAALDYWDPFDEISEDERSRVSVGVNAFLTPSLEVSAYYKMKESVPQDVPGNSDALTLSLHSFF